MLGQAQKRPIIRIGRMQNRIPSACHMIAFRAVRYSWPGDQHLPHQARWLLGAEDPAPADEIKNAQESCFTSRLLLGGHTTYVMVEASESESCGGYRSFGVLTIAQIGCDKMRYIRENGVRDGVLVLR